MAFAEISKYPLEWPIGWPRTPADKISRARFVGKAGSYTKDPNTGATKWVSSERWTVYAALGAVRKELRLLGVDDGNVAFSSNMPQRLDGLPISKAAEPKDHGVAVYFVLQGEPHVLACDRWDRVADNLRAIALHIEAMRGQDRWGVGNLARAFSGYGVKQLAAMGERKTCWQILGVKEGATEEEIRDRFHKHAQKHHPDRPNGNGNRMAEISAAYEEALRVAGATP